MGAHCAPKLLLHKKNKKISIQQNTIIAKPFEISLHLETQIGENKGQTKSLWFSFLSILNSKILNRKNFNKIKGETCQTKY